MRFIDQMGREIEFSAKSPLRIISLVPSQTELLYDLGLDEEVVGVTQFCVHPTRARKMATRIGGTKTIRMEAIHTLKPDLIIANKEENDRLQIESLAAEYPVWISDIQHPEDDLEMIISVGMLCNKAKEAERLAAKKRQAYTAAKNRFLSLSRKRVLYLIWREPYMGVGKQTYIDSMLSYLGFENALAEFDRYPVLHPDIIGEIAPDLIFLSSEPYPFKNKHRAEFCRYVSRDISVLLVNGEYFSWYGTRLLHLQDYPDELMSLLNPASDEVSERV